MTYELKTCVTECKFYRFQELQKGIRRIIITFVIILGLDSESEALSCIFLALSPHVIKTF